jgi:hypothetical protein
MRNRVIVAVVTAAGLFCATSCSGSSTAGTPSPAQQTSATQSSVPAKLIPPYGGAPKVTNPLPDSVLSGSPCDALTPEQVKVNLGAEETGKLDRLAGIGPQCTWSNLDTGGQINVFFSTEDHLGLSGAYANSRPRMKTFKELPPIQGLPAVAYSPKAGPTPDHCEVTVGITDTLSVDIAVSLSIAKFGKVDACSIVPDTANDVITTLKQKA